MKYIQIDLLNEIAILRINRPEALNAMNLDVIFELARAIDIISADEGIKVTNNYRGRRTLFLCWC